MNVTWDGTQLCWISNLPLTCCRKGFSFRIQHLSRCVLFAVSGFIAVFDPISDIGGGSALAPMQSPHASRSSQVGPSGNRGNECTACVHERIRHRHGRRADSERASVLGTGVAVQSCHSAKEAPFVSIRKPSSSWSVDTIYTGSSNSRAALLGLAPVRQARPAPVWSEQ